MNHWERFVRTLTVQSEDRVPFIKVFGRAIFLEEYFVGQENSQEEKTEL